MNKIRKFQNFICYFLGYIKGFIWSSFCVSGTVKTFYLPFIFSVRTLDNISRREIDGVCLQIKMYYRISHLSIVDAIVVILFVFISAVK